MKKKILSPIVVFSTFLFISGCGGGSTSTNITKPVTPPAPVTPVAANNMVLTPAVAQINNIEAAIRHTNELRSEKGLPPLVIDPSLQAYAQKRAEEIVGQFSHTRPDGTTLQALKGGSAGENIAKSSRNDPLYVVKTLWRNSDGHYQNIINTNWKKIGIGMVADPNSPTGFYWVQVFGDDRTTTDYAFALTTNNRVTMAAYTSPLIALQSHLASKVTYNSNGQIAYLAPSAIKATSISPSGDPAAEAFGASKVTNPAFSQAYIYDHNNYKVMVRDPKVAGWQYQTFGRITQLQNQAHKPIGYANFGKATAPAAGATLKADYRGVAMGDHGSKTVLADFSASIDFSDAKKTMDITLNNSQAKDNNTGTWSKDAVYDFTKQLNWSASTNSFVNGQNTASLYGGNFEEVGGQFAHQVNGQAYTGAFGGKKAP